LPDGGEILWWNFAIHVRKESSVAYMEEYLGNLIIASRLRNVVVIWSSKKEFA